MSPRMTPKTARPGPKPYAVMDAGLRAQKRDIVFSLCQYGMANVWEWASEVHGNSWRTTNDIGGSWGSMAGIGFHQGGHEPYVKPGCWNDPDMMTVGFMGYAWTDLDDDEQYTEVSLWSLLAAPLILGNDLTRIDAFTHNLLCNDEVIKVNQDPLGRMARCVATRGGAKVYAKEMSDGSMAVGFFNLGDETVPVSASWSELKLKAREGPRPLAPKRSRPLCRWILRRHPAPRLHVDPRSSIKLNGMPDLVPTALP